MRKSAWRGGRARRGGESVPRRGERASRRGERWKERRAWRGGESPTSLNAAPRCLPARWRLLPRLPWCSYASIISGASAASSAARPLGLECGTCLARGKDAAPVWQSSGSLVRHACCIAGRWQRDRAAALPASSAILSNFGPAAPDQFCFLIQLIASRCNFQLSDQSGF